MPIKFSGIYTCEKCQKAFEWIYLEPHRDRYSSSFYTAEEIPNNKAFALEYNKNIRGNYDVIVNCRHCNYENHFIFEPLTDI